MLWKFKKNMRRESGEIYMVRYHLIKTRLLSIYLNKICQPDTDPWLHNHPWRKSWSLKLRGFYWERIAVDAGELFTSITGVSAPDLTGREIYFDRVPGRLSRVPEKHRILALGNCEPVWTLFIGWRSDRPWGFIDPATGEVVDWKTRIKQRGMTPEEARR